MTEKSETTITPDVYKTIELFKEMYSFTDNADVIVRPITIATINKVGYILFLETIVDTANLGEFILKPLLENPTEADTIEKMLPAQTLTKEQEISRITAGINNGSVALFVEDDPSCYLMNFADFKSRNIESSQNEIALKGPKETFVENVDTNISLIRKKVKNENLTFKKKIISTRSHDDLYICYLKDLTNDALLEKLEKRIDRIDVGSLQNLSMLEQYIEDRPRSIFPSILYTERPDRSARALEKGGIVLLMNNSSDSLILPTTFWDLFHSAEDEYLRFLNGFFIRIVRVLALLITLLISAFYISVTVFHPEMIPPDLLLAIVASREKVPFTPFIEILIMETAFELIREAGLRVPLPIGPTIGIVGALILGQAAVQANVVSPVVVIVVALGALSSFVIGDIGLNFSIRTCRFLFISSAYLYGFFGTVSVFVILLMYLISLRSLGIPYFLPVSPSYLNSNGTTVSRNILRDQFLRPKYLQPKDETKS